MCNHHWHIDSCNKGKCELCGKIKDFQPRIDKVFGADLPPWKLPMRRPLISGEYYLQGGKYRGGYAFGDLTRSYLD